MNSTIVRLASLLLLGMCGCGKSQPDTLVTGGFDEQEMEQAIARAKSEVDAFIVQLQAKNGEDFAVKAPIEENGVVEHFWISNVTYRDGQFEGTIGNDPGMVKKVKFGDKWTISKSEISDWTYTRDGLMYGNYTMRPLLKTLPPEEAEKMRKMLAEP